MRLIALTALLAAAGAAPLPAHRAGEVYWTKIYPTSLYKEIWNGELAVADLKKDVVRAVAAIEKAGGRLAQPPQNFAFSETAGTQQLSFAASREGAAAALKGLRKVGALPDPRVSPTAPRPPLEEIRAKIAAITEEKRTAAQALARTPAASAALDEVLEHLLLVESLSRPSDSDVLFNLTVRRK